MSAQRSKRGHQMSDDKEQFRVTIREDQIIELKRLYAEDHEPVSKKVQDAIDDYLEKIRKSKRR
jgi:hypothetical protein